MQSSVNQEWNKPIAFSSEFARMVEAQAEKYAGRCRQYLLDKAGFRPTEFGSHAELSAHFGDNQTIEQRFLIRDLARIEEIAWSVDLKNGTIIKDITVDDLISLGNKGDREIVSARIANSSYEFAFEMNFRDNLYRNTAFKLSGEYELTQIATGNISDMLDSATFYWHPIRRNNFFFGIWMFNILGIAALAILVKLNEKLYDSFGYFLNPLGLIMISLAGLIPALALLLKKYWEWVFPFVDFEIGSGVKRASVRRNIRAALWSVPVLLFAIPIGTNLISDRIG